MTKVLVLYYSAYGHIETMADAVAEGARVGRRRGRSSSACPRRCPTRSPSASHFKLDQAAPIATVDELADYDAIIFGTPTRFGNMAAQMRNFLDQTGGLWMKGALVGKVGSVFASSATQHGGQEIDDHLVPPDAAASGHGHRRPALCLPGPDGPRRDQRRLALRRLDDRRRRRQPPALRRRARRRPLPGQHVAKIAAKLAA